MTRAVPPCLHPYVHLLDFAIARAVASFLAIVRRAAAGLSISPICLLPTSSFFTLHSLYLTKCFGAAGDRSRLDSLGGSRISALPCRILLGSLAGGYGPDLVCLSTSRLIYMLWRISHGGSPLCSTSSMLGMSAMGVPSWVPVRCRLSMVESGASSCGCVCGRDVFGTRGGVGVGGDTCVSSWVTFLGSQDGLPRRGP